MWDLKPFSIYILSSQEKNYFFNVEFEAFSIYILCLQKKKVMFFQREIKKYFWFKYFNLKR